MMPHPARAIDLLVERLAHCYEQYVAISALRFYFPEMFAEYDGRPGMMPICAGKPYPDFVVHIGTTWLISSQSRAVFVLDCGTQGVVRRIQRMQAKGQLGAVEGLWITHYHDDHVDAIPQFRDAFNCPVIADKRVVQVVEDPLAWRLPCISPVQIQVDRRTEHGESWAWREFTFTAYHLPGQTHYHGGLLVKGRGTRILFVGDSFTPSGLDDYCAGNRNLLGHNKGFDACLALVQQIAPQMMLNSHVDTGFNFTAEDCASMRANLAEREKSYGDLVPWGHANYGLDEHWVRCHPYEQHVSPGTGVQDTRVQIDVIVTNHSNHRCTARCRPVPPPQWQIDAAAAETTIAPKTEGRIALVLDIPHDAAPGRWVIPIDVIYDGRRLGQCREAIVVIKGRIDNKT
jgi:glyoxylase-like metal-dependent hydrolase (beta-lactamase superfamily II)